MRSVAASLAPDGFGPRQARDWTEGAIIAVLLHAAFAMLVVMAVRAQMMEGKGKTDDAIEIDLPVALPIADAPKNPDAGGGGAGGAIRSPVPLPPDAPRLGPVVPPDMIEPVKGAPVARTSGPLPVGYGAGFGGGMGGGIGRGTGKGIGTGTGAGIAPPAPRPAGPVAAGARYTELSVAQFARLIRYPQSALDEGVEADGRVAFVLKPDGTVIRWYVEKSTGRKDFDHEIERAAKKIDAFDAVPGLEPGQIAVVHIPIGFHLAKD